MDTINANGGQAIPHPAVFQRHLDVAIKKDCAENGTDIATMNDATKETLQKKLKEPARESSSAEYLACLFLLLADNDRFKPLKREINNIFLMGGEKREVPHQRTRSQEADDRLLRAGRSHTSEGKSSRHGCRVRAEGKSGQ